MSNLLMLIVMVIASVGVAALILRLSEIIIITVPVMLTQAVKGRAEREVGDMGETPLHVAISKNEKRVIEALLKAGASREGSSIWCVPARRHITTASSSPAAQLAGFV